MAVNGRGGSGGGDIGGDAENRNTRLTWGFLLFASLVLLGV